MAWSTRRLSATPEFLVRPSGVDFGSIWFKI